MNVDKPLLERALAAYFDRPVVTDFTSMGEGQENTSVKVTLADGNTYVVRIWGKTHGIMGMRLESDIAGELDFMIHCYDQGVPVPKVHMSRQGNRYERLPSGDDYVVMDYVSGELPSDITSDMVRQVATAMAHMHKLAENFHYAAPRSWPGTVVEMTNQRLQRLPKIPAAQEFMGFITPIQTAYESALRTTRLDVLPRGPIHGDIMWENMKFADGQLQGIFDFDDCRDSYFLEDLTKTILFAFEKPEHCFFGVDGEHVPVFLNAYAAVRPLTEQEAALLPLFFTVSYLYRLSRYMLKVVDGRAVYWNRIPALVERYKQNPSFFLPTVQ